MSNVTTAAPFQVASTSTVSVQAGGSGELILGTLCRWTTEEWLCYGTIFPILLWVACAVVVVVVLCMRTAVGKEYQRLADWSESTLVPESIKNLPPKRRERIVARLRPISLQKIFNKLNLDEAFGESCAAVGVATIGDLLLLRPVFLRDLGFGVTEKQQIMRTIEKRGQFVDELHRTRDAAIELASGVPTDVEEANASNRGDVKYFLVKPHEGYLKTHATKEVLRGGGGAGATPFSTVGTRRGFNALSNSGGGSSSVPTSLAMLMQSEVHSETVSCLFWDFFRSQFAESRSEGVEPPLISIAAGNRRSARVSKAFYLKMRKRWDDAQSRLLLIRVSFVSAFKRIRVRHAPVTILVNEQFWLGFVLRWNLQQQRQVQTKALERARKEAKERLKILDYEAQLAASRRGALDEASRGASAKKRVGEVIASVAAAPKEAMRKLEGLFSPVGRMLTKARLADATPAATDGRRRPSETSSDFSMVEYPDEDGDESASRARRLATMAGTTADRAHDSDSELTLDDSDSDSEDAVDVGDDAALSPEDRDRAEVLELDPFTEGWETVHASTQEESFSVNVSFGRYLDPLEYEGSRFVLDNILSHSCGTGGAPSLPDDVRSTEEAANDDELLKDILSDTNYVTSVVQWNKYVHEFQEGEIGVAVPRRTRRRPKQAPKRTAAVTGSQQQSASSNDNIVGLSELQDAERSDDGEGEEMQDYQHPVLHSISPEFTVQLHIISIMNTSERFDEMRKKLLMMRGDGTLEEWKATQQQQQRFDSPTRRSVVPAMLKEDTTAVATTPRRHTAFAYASAESTTRSAFYRESPPRRNRRDDDEGSSERLRHLSEL